MTGSHDPTHNPNFGHQPRIAFGVYSEQAVYSGHSVNEDFCVANGDAGMFVVADGRGEPGHGHLASELAANEFVQAYEQAIAEGLHPVAAATRALAKAREAMTKAKDKKEIKRQAGAVLAAVCLDPDTGEAVVVVAGDVDVMLIDENGEFQRLAPIQSAKDNGIDGIDPNAPDYVRHMRFKPGSRIGIFSDGFKNGYNANMVRLTPSEQQDLAARRRQAALLPNPQEAAYQLLYSVSADILTPDGRIRVDDDTTVLLIDVPQRS
jgi:hypothetical protein